MFDPEVAKAYLKQKEEQEKEDKEKDRQIILDKVVTLLKKEFANSAIEVFLVGSITEPYRFSKISDIDIVLKNFKGDRFEVWSRLEGLIEKKIEIILYENCSFKEHIDAKGLRII